MGMTGADVTLRNVTILNVTLRNVTICKDGRILRDPTGDREKRRLESTLTFVASNVTYGKQGDIRAAMLLKV